MKVGEDENIPHLLFEAVTKHDMLVASTAVSSKEHTGQQTSGR
jgi:hypothetical protein